MAFKCRYFLTLYPIKIFLELRYWQSLIINLAKHEFRHGFNKAATLASPLAWVSTTLSAGTRKKLSIGPTNFPEHQHFSKLKKMPLHSSKISAMYFYPAHYTRHEYKHEFVFEINKVIGKQGSAYDLPDDGPNCQNTNSCRWNCSTYLPCSYLRKTTEPYAINTLSMRLGVKLTVCKM